MAEARLREFAENANTHQALAPGHERIETVRYVLWMGIRTEPSWNVVQRLRLTESDIDATIAEVHGLIAARGRSECSWEIGSSATPPDLVDQLRHRGMVDDDDPLLVAMALDQEPAEVAGIEARPVRDLGEFRAAQAVAFAAFGTLSPSDEAHERARYDEEVSAGAQRTFVALVDGRIVGSGTAVYLDGAVTLNGGAVLPEARGRGVYRALVRARWEDAVERGTPALVTQAGRMSAPILLRLGFREIARIHVLIDRFG
ncbi:MAG TPA: GNAT family N-acetyltransferase [Gaiellales bacterium]|nr:GNAT family N-acetyltransferase [Gaiellales bacterium]